MSTSFLLDRILKLFYILHHSMMKLFLQFSTYPANSQYDTDSY